MEIVEVCGRTLAGDRKQQRRGEDQKRILIYLIM